MGSPELAFFCILFCSCASTQEANPTIHIVDTACDWVAPISMSYADFAGLPADIRRRILTHNLQWEEHCLADKGTNTSSSEKSY